MSTWPDGTPRSSGNAFDWQGKGGSIATSREWKHSESSKLQMQRKPGKPITIYTRAKSSK